MALIFPQTLSQFVWQPPSPCGMPAILARSTRTHGTAGPGGLYNQEVGVLNNPADRYYVAPMWGMLDVVAQGISRMLGLYEEVLRITHPPP